MTADCASPTGRFLTALIVGLGLSLPSAMAHGPRVLPEGEQPKDARLGGLKDLDGYFPFEAPRTSAAWKERSQHLRHRVQVALGLWPPPTRTPLNAVIHGLVEREDYTVEKVYFESLPGFYVTGNLYRPKGRSAPHPGMLCPHGHWEDGRFMDVGADKVRQEIEQGGERFEEGGRSPLQARCVGLARMGCVVFHYDMLGYADNVQIPMEIAHGFAEQRPEMSSVENWGLFSAPAEAHFQSVMGLQTWNSIRALDFLESLPDVDRKRLGVTGASGGGTQTFVLGAVDPRPALAFPAVMVSTAMQGGCPCENASGLRVGTGNVELAALFAPKPLGLTTANDWTREMASKGFPQLKELFDVLHAPNHVMIHRGEQFEHNYNAPSRQALYSWVNQRFGLELPEPIAERDYLRLTTQEMTVWDDAHPKPVSGPDFERSLLRWLHEDAQSQLAAAASSPAEFRKLYGRGLETSLGRSWDEVGKVEWMEKSKVKNKQFTVFTGLIRNSTHKEELTAVLLAPAKPSGKVVLWIHPDGKSGLFEGDAPCEHVSRLLAADVTVAGADLLFQGEFLSDGQPTQQNRRVKNPREIPAYTFGYNPSLFAQRVHDVLSAIKWLQRMKPAPEEITVIGLAGAGPWVAAARALARSQIRRVAIDTAGFRFGHVLDPWSPNFLPGGAKYGDLPGMLAMGGPGVTWLAGEPLAGLALVRTVYGYSDNQRRLTIFPGPATESASAAIDWVLKK